MKNEFERMGNVELLGLYKKEIEWKVKHKFTNPIPREVMMGMQPFPVSCEYQFQKFSIEEIQIELLARLIPREVIKLKIL